MTLRHEARDDVVLVFDILVVNPPYVIARDRQIPSEVLRDEARTPRELVVRGELEGLVEDARNPVVEARLVLRLDPAQVLVREALGLEAVERRVNGALHIRQVPGREGPDPEPEGPGELQAALERAGPVAGPPTLSKSAPR